MNRNDGNVGDCPKATPVDVQLNDLESYLKDLESSLQVLKKVLKPVLNPDIDCPDDKCDEGKCIALRSPLTERIVISKDQVAHINGFVVELLEHLEV